MLANAGRTTVRRLVVDLSKTPTANLSHGLVSRSVLQAQNAWNGSTVARRLLATTTSDPKSPASKITRTTRKTVTKKPTKSKRSPAKPRAAPKKKVASRKKKVAARPKPVKRKLTPEQKEKAKEKAKAKKERETVLALKKLVLEKPKTLPRSAYMVVFAEFAAKGPAGVKEATAKYKSLTKEELVHYEHIANQNKATNEAIYKKWVESYTPEQIRSANKARASLRRRSPGGRGRFPKLKDERQVPKPPTSFLLFAKERSASGDYKHLKPTETGRLLGKQWRELPEHEKKKYNDVAAESLSRYRETIATVYKDDASQAAKSGAAL
ncbi:hypothetical protein FGG08_001674 [Glutinoglossum americanum]|uniref:HMG box domain-containing protein n=1 Tax=Glutinoglossum americanum TaxID=1670608 RepID=A0A9P8I7R0_9PEZI|nr:hypothetical protein FGG08_001674 [Glutinoglossum americanum]